MKYHFIWLPVKFCINLKILLLTYKSLHTPAPRYLPRGPPGPLTRASWQFPTRDSFRGEFQKVQSTPFLWGLWPLTHEAVGVSLRHLFSNSRPHPAPCAFCTLTHLPTHTPSPPTLVKRPWVSWKALYKIYIYFYYYCQTLNNMEKNWLFFIILPKRTVTLK